MVLNLLLQLHIKETNQAYIYIYIYICSQYVVSFFQSRNSSEPIFRKQLLEEDNLKKQ